MTGVSFSGGVLASVGVGRAGKWSCRCTTGRWNSPFELICWRWAPEGWLSGWLGEVWLWDAGRSCRCNVNLEGIANHFKIKQVAGAEGEGSESRIMGAGGEPIPKGDNGFGMERL